MTAIDAAPTPTTARTAHGHPCAAGESAARLDENPRHGRKQPCHQDRERHGRVRQASLERAPEKERHQDDAPARPPSPASPGPVAIRAGRRRPTPTGRTARRTAGRSRCSRSTPPSCRGRRQPPSPRPRRARLPPTRRRGSRTARATPRAHDRDRARPRPTPAESSWPTPPLLWMNSRYGASITADSGQVDAEVLEPLAPRQAPHQDQQRAHRRGDEHAVVVAEQKRHDGHNGQPEARAFGRIVGEPPQQRNGRGVGQELRVVVVPRLQAHEEQHAHDAQRASSRWRACTARRSATR